MIGYWLMPAAAQKRQLAAVIEQLARKYDAPLFEPHVTLYSSDDDEAAAAALVERVAPRFAPVTLLVCCVEQSARFTKSLFVQFENNADAQRLSDSIRAESQSQTDYEFEPHLSLIYAALPSATKAAEARAVHLPFDGVTFETISAITFPRPIRSRGDVEAWRIITTADLRGS